LLPNFIPIAIKDNHFGITRFASSDENPFKVISKILQKWVDELEKQDRDYFPNAHFLENVQIRELESLSNDT